MNQANNLQFIILPQESALVLYIFSIRFNSVSNSVFNSVSKFQLIKRSLLISCQSFIYLEKFALS